MNNVNAIIPDEVVLFIAWMGVIVLLVAVVWYIADRKFGMNEEKQMMYIVPGLVTAMFYVFGLLFWWGFFLVAIFITGALIVMTILGAGNSDDDIGPPPPPGGGDNGPDSDGTPPDRSPTSYLDTPDSMVYDDAMSDELVGV